jgi:hypothetical protein
MSMTAFLLVAVAGLLERRDERLTCRVASIVRAASWTA